MALAVRERGTPYSLIMGFLLLGLGDEWGCERMRSSDGGVRQQRLLVGGKAGLISGLRLRRLREQIGKRPETRLLARSSETPSLGVAPLLGLGPFLRLL